MQVFVLVTIFLISLSFVKADYCFPKEIQYTVAALDFRNNMAFFETFRSEPKNLIVLDYTKPNNWSTMVGRIWLVPKDKKVYYLSYSTGKCSGISYKANVIEAACVTNVKSMANSTLGNIKTNMISGKYTSGPHKGLECVIEREAGGSKKLLYAISNLGTKYDEKTFHKYTGFIQDQSVFNIPSKCFNNKILDISKKDLDSVFDSVLF